SRSHAHLPGDAHLPYGSGYAAYNSGLQGHDAYADRAAGCVAGGIKHGHAHTGYMIAAGCCAGPAAAKEETWKAVSHHSMVSVYHLKRCTGGHSFKVFNRRPLNLLYPAFRDIQPVCSTPDRQPVDIAGL